jgi:hypothetical protein
MATYTELSCFNKLLLDKMRRMEIEHKKRYDKLNKTYESLRDLATDDTDYHCCDFCNRWFDGSWEHKEDGFILDHDNGDSCCGNCVEYGLNTWLKKCVDCDEVVNLKVDHGFPKRNQWGELKPHSDDVICSYCFKTNLLNKELNKVDFDCCNFYSRNKLEFNTNRHAWCKEDYIEDHVIQLIELNTRFLNTCMLWEGEDEDISLIKYIKRENN